MRKTSLALAVSIVAVAVTAGCSSSSSSGTTAASSAAGSQTAGGKCSGTGLKIGVEGSLSGPAAALGGYEKEGATLALNEFNAAGGLGGQCVKVAYADDKNDPTTAAQVTRQLLEQDGVKALIGPNLSDPTGAALPITTQAKVIEIVQSASPLAGEVAKYPYAFLAQSTVSTLGEAYVQYLKKNKITKLGELVVNNAFGLALQGSFESAVKGSGIQIIGAQTFASGSTDVSSQVGKLKSAGVQAIVADIAIDPDFIAAIKGRNSASWSVPILGVQSIADAAVTQTVGAAGMKDVYAVAYTALTRTPGSREAQSPAVNAFQKTYLAANPGAQLNGSLYQVATGYDAMKMLLAAYKATGKTDSAMIKQYLETHSYQGIAAHYTFTAAGHFGVPVTALGFALASSAQGGLMQLAPGS